jgi:hypothetical protein
MRKRENRSFWPRARSTGPKALSLPYVTWPDSYSTVFELAHIERTGRQAFNLTLNPENVRWCCAL